MAVFELSDADVEVEIVVRRKNSSSSGNNKPVVTTTTEASSSHDVPLGEEATKHSLLVDAGSVLSREVQLEVAKHSSLVQADMVLPRDLQLRDGAKRPCEPTDELMVSLL